MAESVTLTLAGMAHGGVAFGRLAGKVIFVHYALPGEEVRVQITDDRGQYAFARLVEVVRPAPERVAPPCPHFGACGGCQWQHAAYAAQLRYKQAIVAEQLERIGGLTAPRVLPAAASPDEWHYRNHARFVPVAGAASGPVLGFHALESHDVVPIRACPLLTPALGELYAGLDLELGTDVTAVHLRAGVRTDSVMLIFETGDDLPPEIELDLPVSCALLLADGQAAALIGETAIADEVAGRSFCISPGSFFQANTAAADLLVRRVLDYLDLPASGGGTVLDAYCGVGLFSAFLAPRCARLVAIEVAQSACDNFAENLDEFENVELYAAAVEDALPALVAQGLRCDAAVLDPPRTGCAPAALDALAASGAQRVVYVSCDPASFARDVKRLAALGYSLVEALPVDLFPQTYHTEIVALLTAGA